MGKRKKGMKKRNEETDREGRKEIRKKNEFRNK